ncbi:MAG: UvrD-helicase domain-containing protein [Calditrichaeota bacterium]|nr:UvrD-helicase domain-containing protein [Calditrichota bacterium]
MGNKEKQTTLLRNLNSVQRKAVEHTNGPSLILAGAGSGKTRVLTHKIAYLIERKGINPGNILAMTFTNKAAREMKERISALLNGELRGLWIGTFHSNFARILRKDCSKIGYTPSFVIYDEADQLSLVKSVINELEIINAQNLKPKQIQSYIKIIKNSSISLEEFKLRNPALSNEVFYDIFNRYNNRLLQNNAMDFEDLLGKSHELFRLFPTVLSHYQELFHYILVDEYQDTNRIQYKLIKLLGEKHRNISVVGDDDQSIYRWRGAEIRNILDFEKDFPDCKIFRLEQNYRSTANILHIAHSIIRNNYNRMDKELWTKKGEGEKITLKIVNNASDEANYVVMKIEEEMQKNHHNFSDFAVLFRINAQSRALEDALRSRGINYIIVGGIRFYERKEIKDVLAYLKLLANPQDSVSLKRIINYPARGIGKTTIERLEEFCAQKNISLFNCLLKAHEVGSLQKSKVSTLKQLGEFLQRYVSLKEQLSPSELTSALIDELGILLALKAEGTEEAATRMENIKELINGIKEFSKQNSELTLEHYLESVALITSVDNWDRSVNAVSLLTLHSAKGLEFPVVFITGLEEGLFPLSRQAGSIESLEEERRLFYVGATRAMEKLYLTAAKFRWQGGSDSTSGAISRFLAELDKTYVEADEEIGYYSHHRAPKRSFSQSVKKSDNLRQKSDNNQPPELRVGALVRHPRFGKGIIRKIESGNEANNPKLFILFEGLGEKKIIYKYAKLEILR